MDVVGRAARLREQRVPHALATVVQSRKPSSGKPGDRAIITADAHVEGWVGGACAETVVTEEALAALAAGRSRYVVLDADATETSSDGDRVTHPLTCHSGGAIELFIEPFAPPLQVSLAGDSPVSRALEALCAAAGFDVAATADPTALSVPPGAFVVVATMGKGDEIAARTALLAGAPYVAVVASSRRAGAIRAWLTEHDVPEEALGSLHSPAGLDIGARGAEGVAVSILAEIVAESARLGPFTGAPAGHRVPQHAPEQVATIDPVCGMTADPGTSPTAEYGGRLVAFCSTHCRDVFLADPERYLGARAP